MHIKKLTIQGFKSYRDQIVIDPFSEKVNIVVGRNGAGKSNFFSAIRFVLSDAYTSMQRAERQALLHEGSSTTATFSAYVEIVFDNADGRIPTGKAETILRRTIGSKKDDYALDRKSTSKGEVMALLESAGFSRSNPFFIVPQGRVTALTNQKDPERLELLKEIAGTRLYEDKRSESVRIMEETDQKRAKIDELLVYIDERLEELEEEKEELRQYRDADKTRRCLAYSINQHDLEQAKAALDAIDIERHNETVAEEERSQEARKRQADIAVINAKLVELEEEVETLSLERSQAEADRTESVKARTQVNLTIRDLEESNERAQGQRKGMQADLDAVNASIAKAEKQLADIQPNYDETLRQESTARLKLEQMEARQATLFAKQGRTSQFRNQAERDTFLRKEIQKNTTYLSAREEGLRVSQRSIEEANENLTTAREREAEINQELEAGKQTVAKLANEAAEVRKELEEKNEERKETWKSDAIIENSVKTAREAQRQAEDQLYRTMDRSTKEGLQAVEKIAERLRLGGVHGPLYQLFETEDIFRTAVEVTAGNSLFHVVVDSDDTASRILEVMVKERSGRVTFVPLNRLKPKAVNYPTDGGEAAPVPMIAKLNYDRQYEAAIQQVFSRTIIVPDLTLGSKYSRSHGLTAITLAGDKVEKKGSMTGGYHAPEQSRLRNIKTLKAQTERLETDSAKQKELKRGMTVLDQQITALKGREQVVAKRLRTARDAREPLQRELQERQLDIENIRSRIERLGKQQTEAQSEVSALKIQLEALQDELRTKMVDALSDEEVATMDKLGIDTQALKRDLAQLTIDRSNLASKKSTLEMSLSQNLLKKRTNLLAKLDGLSDGSDVGGGVGGTQDVSSAALAAKRSELAHLDTLLTRLQAKLDAIDKASEKAKSEIQKQRTAMEAEQSKVSDEAQALARQQRHLERNLGRRQALLGKRDELNRKIRDLGVLPDEAYQMHAKGFKVETLIKKHQKALETLKKFTSVNKKAFDQYDDFTKQRETLTDRREELDTSGQSITDLIDVLDQRKDEAIERTFKQVSRNFAEVFEKLVPAGRGRLIMQTRLDEGEGGEEEVVEEEEAEEEDNEDEDAESDGLEGEEEEEEEEDDEEPASKRRKKGAAANTQGKGKGKGKAKTKAKDKTRKSITTTAKAKKASKTGKAARHQSKIDSYTGVSIKVSFNSKSDEGLRITQLSGGQKSLVALAMIFAIQKCDPAPFYLFDEIDANLDADRRTAVAAMIRELSEHAQFIITTFRPELLASADHYLGVVFDARKVSSIRPITHDDAVEFVESSSGRG